jgi:plasmid stabilization system protein ParE
VAEIVWTREAADSLEQIHDYIAAERPAAAHKVVSEIYDKIQLLRTHPLLGFLKQQITELVLVI